MTENLSLKPVTDENDSDRFSDKLVTSSKHYLSLALPSKRNGCQPKVTSSDKFLELVQLYELNTVYMWSQPRVGREVSETCHYLSPGRSTCP